MKESPLINKNKRNISPVIVKNIVKKAREFRKQNVDKARFESKIPVKAFVPDELPDPMTTYEATKYLRVSKTTLMAYENYGFLKAIRNILPDKSRGKVTWTKEQLDRVKFGTYKNN
jgi:hypothetical protein